MKRAQSLLLLAIVAAVSAAWVGPARAQIPTLPPDGGHVLASPACSIFDRELAPRSIFRRGEGFYVRGQGFKPAALVLLSFEQGSKIELGRFKTDEKGSFSTEPRAMTLPTEAAGGPAGIRAEAEGVSATCLIRVLVPASASLAPKAAEAKGKDPTALFLIWAAVLAVCGGGLGYAWYRRWQHGRLDDAMTKLNGDGVSEPPILPIGWDAGREPRPSDRQTPR